MRTQERTNGQKNMTKLMVAFRNFEKAPQNLLQVSAYEIHLVPLYKSIERKCVFSTLGC